jgi:hypothetical protein
MKCLGIVLIVYGHVGSASIAALTPPIYPKQLGVAFFLFATGFSLAGEKRSVRRVLFSRLFELYLFGISFAIICSAVVWAWSGQLNLSNYEPFLLGANVRHDYFPANPTTWYIGTYIHVLLVWAFVLRNRRIGWWVIVPVAVAEVIVRFFLAETLGHFLAYMALSNWATVFLVGTYCGLQQPDQVPRTGLLPHLCGLVSLAIAWPLIISLWPRHDQAFPFQVFDSGTIHSGMAITAAAVTFLYVVYTVLVYQVTRRVRAPRVVEFCARNTVIVFIAHMPVYYVLNHYIEAWVRSEWLLVAIRFAVCFVGLTVLSEVICRVVRPKVLRDRAWSLLTSSGINRSRPERDQVSPARTPSTAVRL